MSIINPFIDELPSRQPEKPRQKRIHNIKFPIDAVLKLKLRTLCKQMSRFKGEVISQTNCNTMLLRYGLKHLDCVNWDIPYQDCKVYMHTHLKKETEYPLIGGPFGLAIRYGLSERRTVYCIMVAALRRIEQGGTLEEII